MKLLWLYRMGEAHLVMVVTCQTVDLPVPYDWTGFKARGQHFDVGVGDSSMRWSIIWSRNSTPVGRTQNFIIVSRQPTIWLYPESLQSNSYPSMLIIIQIQFIHYGHVYIWTVE
jgi:hypothetical protein